MVFVKNFIVCSCCGETIDKKGIHPLSCLKNSSKYYQHAEVNNKIKKDLISVNVPSQLEPIGSDRTDGKRPNGVTLVPWRKGQCLIWDNFRQNYHNILSL